MINFYLGQFVLGQTFLRLAKLEAEAGARADRDAVVPDARWEQLSEWVALGIRDCIGAIDLREGQSTAVRLENLFGNYKHQPIYWGELHELLKRLSEDIDQGIGAEFFFHYDRSNAARVLLVEKEWEKAFAAFTSIKKEIIAAIDCYALQHHNACSYQLMRAAEVGLRALTRERQITWPKHPVEWATWQDMLGEIEKSIKPIALWPRGERRDAALGFNTGTLGQFHAFKELYRNAVMHVRADYDGFDALRAIGQVHDFMTGLSEKIGEKTRGPIRKWP